jgi:hypothetical protein
MLHLSRLLVSTKAQVCFISETRNASITRASIKNRFNYKDAFVVLAQGQSGGLWLIWNDDVDLTVVDHSHHFIFALCINKSSLKQYGLVCLYGDPHHCATSTIWTQVLNFVVTNSNLPILCMGDMNNIMHVNEKLGPTRADVRRINEFCAHVKQCGFIDLGYSGPAYTWTNKRFTTNPTYERLDRCLDNAEWCVTFPAMTIYHLPMMRSDHASILAVLNSQRFRTNKPFRFENWWLMEHEYHTVARQSWQRSTNRTFTQKTSFLASNLRRWRKSKPRNADLLTIIENQILDQQSKPPNQQDFSLQQHLTQQHHDLLLKEETYHLQRAKKNWAILGDQNTSFFHQAIVKRNRKNRITHLINPDGTQATSPDQLAASLVHYFQTIFTTQSPTHQPSVRNITHQSHLPTIQQQDDFNVPHQSHHTLPLQSANTPATLMQNEMYANTTPAQDRYTNSSPNLQEIHAIVKEMRSNAAPGLDGLNAAFYKSAWTWIQQDVYQMVTQFYQSAHLPIDINKTYIALIPKKEQSVTS